MSFDETTAYGFDEYPNSYIDQPDLALLEPWGKQNCKNPYICKKERFGDPDFAEIAASTAPSRTMKALMPFPYYAWNVIPAAALDIKMELQLMIFLLIVILVVVILVTREPSFSRRER